MLDFIVRFGGWVTAAVLAVVLCITSFPASAAEEGTKSPLQIEEGKWYDAGYIYSVAKDKYYQIVVRYHELMGEREVAETKSIELTAPQPEVSSDVPEGSVTVSDSLDPPADVTAAYVAGASPEPAEEVSDITETTEPVKKDEADQAVSTGG